MPINYNQIPEGNMGHLDNVQKEQECCEDNSQLRTTFYFPWNNLHPFGTNKTKDRIRSFSIKNKS